jgi:hypothetical protein
MPALLDPHPLLPTNRISDFANNFRRMEAHAKRPYSLTNIIRGLASNKPRLDALEAEVDEELKALNRTRSVSGVLVPLEALSASRRDLTITPPATGGVTVQTTVGDQVIPFLRSKTICGKLGCTMLDNLTGPNVKLTRSIIGATASWLPEIGGGADSDPGFDSFTLIPKRIQGSTVVSRRLVAQSSPDIEAFVASNIADAIVVAVDNAALNGTGTSSQPLGILNYPANASGSYAYDHRSADVTFGGAATWPNVLAFEKNLELGLIENDGSFGYAVDPATRDKSQQAPKLAGYPSFLWENIPGDDTFGYVNGRRAISTTQLSGGKVIFGKWSELILASWLGVEILVDQYSLATTAEIRIRVSLFADIGFRYALAFCASSDSGSQLKR